MKNSRLDLTDNINTILSKMADGNIGALTVLMQMVDPKNDRIDSDNALGGIGHILALDGYGIYGTDIYVLHNDICGSKLNKTIAVIRAVQLGLLSRETLQQACARQDRSGSSLVFPDAMYHAVKERLPAFDNF